LVSARVVIAGGGIAGLVAAIGLARQGFAVSLYEKAPHLKEVGAGIQLGPNATRILQKWGALERLTPHAFAPQFIHLYDGVRGKRLVSLPVGHFVQHHWHAPYLTIHRADLQQILVEIVRNQPQVTFYCDHEVVGVTGNLTSGFEVEIAHGAKNIIKQADLFLACDGVWSRFRAGLPLQEKAEDSGFIAWRATLDSSQLPSNFRALEQGDNVHVFMGRHGHFVAYPLRGGREFNFVAITKNAVSKTHPAPHFAGWANPVREVLAFCQDWTYWPLFTMKLPRFIGARGEIFLGDSAHATTPFAAQGAALAIEDAAALVQALSSPANSWQESLEQFPKSVKRFSDKNCGKNKGLEHLASPSEAKNALEIFSQKRVKRVLDVKKRGTFNQFVYHVGMPLSLGRNIFMTYRNPAKFLKDMDWLYNPPSHT